MHFRASSTIHSGECRGEFDHPSIQIQRAGSHSDVLLSKSASLG
jgi:hypothetical protein